LIQNGAIKIKNGFFGADYQHKLRLKCRLLSYELIHFHHFNQN